MNILLVGQLHGSTLTDYTSLLENITATGTYNLNGKLSDYKYIYVLTGYSGGEDIGQLIPYFMTQINETFENNHSVGSFQRRIIYKFVGDTQINVVCFDTTQFYIKKVYGVN